MPILYSLLNRLKRTLPALLLVPLSTLPVFAGGQDDTKVISEVIRAKIIERYVPATNSALVVSYKGQQFYLPEGQTQMVPLTAEHATMGASQVEVLKFKTLKGGDKVRLKLQLENSVVKTTARVCSKSEEESNCSPCKNWRVRFLNTRQRGKQFPDNFFFTS